jgi:5-(carboxyamino)imidazole ribonucleotide mutase
MLSEALQRNAKHEARLSNISGTALSALKKIQRFLGFARNDRRGWRLIETPYNVPMSESKPLVAVIMGSKSDWDTMKNAVETLDELGVPNEARVLSAHRTPDATAEFARGAADRGLRVIIAGAGGAAHLAGVIAGHTWLPVLGVPIQSKLHGLDSLLSTAQMPGGIPVGTLAIGEAGAKNAALLAGAILATSDDTLRQKLESFRRKQSEAVLAAKLPR